MIYATLAQTIVISGHTIRICLTRLLSYTVQACPVLGEAVLKSSEIGIRVRYLYFEFLHTKVLDILSQSRLATPKQEQKQDRCSHKSCVHRGHTIGHSSLKTHNICKLLNYHLTSIRIVSLSKKSPEGLC